MNSQIDIDNIKVSKPVKVKAFSECIQIDDKAYQLTGKVTRDEALVLEDILRLYRKAAGTLIPAELQLVSYLIGLQGKS